MSDAPLAPQCRHCRATNDSRAAECWMCHRRDWREPPLGPNCRHCGATNDSRAAECRMCHRQDWREPPEPPPHSSPQSGLEPLGLGCLFFIALGLIRVVYEAGRFGWIAGIAALVLAVLAFALAIAMFIVCTTVF
jgi:ribosomal protein L40E